MPSFRVSKKSTPFRQRLISFKPLTSRHKYKAGVPSKNPTNKGVMRFRMKRKRFAAGKIPKLKSLETLCRHFPSENGFAALVRQVLCFSSSEVNSVGILLTQNSYAALFRRVLFSILLTQNQLHCQHFFAVLYCGFQLENLVPPRWADSHLWLEFALANLLTGRSPNSSAVYKIKKICFCTV